MGNCATIRIVRALRPLALRIALRLKVCYYSTYNFFVSGIVSRALRSRASELGISDIYLGCADKGYAIKEISRRFSIPLYSIAFVGDDNIDLKAMDIAGYSFAVANASAPIIKAADTTLKHRGGDGVIREIAEILAESNIRISVLLRV